MSKPLTLSPYAQEPKPVRVLGLKGLRDKGLRVKRLGVKDTGLRVEGLGLKGEGLKVKGLGS